MDYNITFPKRYENIDCTVGKNALKGTLILHLDRPEMDMTKFKDNKMCCL